MKTYKITVTKGWGVPYNYGFFELPPVLRSFDSNGKVLPDGDYIAIIKDNQYTIL